MQEYLLCFVNVEITSNLICLQDAQAKGTNENSIDFQFFNHWQSPIWQLGQYVTIQTI